jgi:UPF0042 nucleotide-binding protein
MAGDAKQAGAAAAPTTRLLLVTGMAGAGKTLALKVLEDLGYECVDNLPLGLMDRLLEPPASGLEPQALAVSVDFRTRDFGAEAMHERIVRLRERGDVELTVLFLDCDTEVLRRRFTETRRRHPLAEDRPVMDGILRDRELSRPIAEEADLRIDTSQMSAPDLRRQLADLFTLDTEPGMTITVLSFSYRQGLPREADLVFDVRFLRNPHYVDALRPHTGQDQPVQAYVAGDPAWQPFLRLLTELLQVLVPRYQSEGKSYLTVAFGCTGGRHRSVYVAEEMASRLRALASRVVLRHRELQHRAASEVAA